MAIKNKTLSSQSAELLQKLNEGSRACFTLNEATNYLLSSSRDSVKRLLSDMTKRGLLMRIKEGVYYVIPYEQNPESFMPDWHLLAQYIVGEAKYYVGYYSAMQIHSLITQPALKEQIVVNKQIKPAILKIKDISFQFIYHNEKHFFGRKKTWVDSFNKIECSDLEKTFIDALFKPEYAGGITEIAKALNKSKGQIDFGKMLDYAMQFDSLAVSKRLGYLLDLLKIDTAIIDTLQQLKTRSYFLLEPSGVKEGKMLYRWNIQENIDSQSILSPIYS
ncbi:MAG: type IV toxin-antitoxin system AbiEi family antitoxin [Bacteroidota bacterium]